MITFRFLSFLCYLLIPLVVVLALVWHGSLSRYTASLTVYSVPVFSDTTEEYQYGGFYELQGSEQFSETLQFLFVSPEFVQSIFREAHVDDSGFSLHDYRTFFETETVSSQQIELTYTVETQEDGEKLSIAIQSLLKQRSLALQQRSGQPVRFDLEVSNLVLLQTAPYYIFRVVGGLIAGVLIAWGVVIFVGQQFYKRV